ncbi:vWA domain-containing protein [Actinophytocola sp.]|uniref:vWA domain-containing protein n=1 Tax=Actinophytocola sp. TaxID=1872138 RepID=UPI002EDA8D72
MPVGTLESGGRRPMIAELPDLVARFAAELTRAGLPVGADRAQRFATAITLLEPRTLPELRRCALATLVSDPDQVSTLDSVLDRVFGGIVDPADRRGQDAGVHGGPANSPGPGGGWPTASGRSAGAGGAVEVAAAASAAERLASRDFADLTAAELASLAVVMRRISLRIPRRRSRRLRVAPHGRRTDLRRTLALARRTGGHPLRLVRAARKERPRRLVVLCDISGSMAPYARAMIQLLYCAAGAADAEVFTFATRLTRLTRHLRRSRPGVALARAGRVAPDWSGGTRIASALASLDRSVVRGAVVLIVSDGWETGDPASLARQMARISAVAHRVVWANPRTARPGYRPLAGGMAAAWPYCDAVVSGHRFDALDELVSVLARPL